jgi:predicted metal-dependent hydrolase
MDVEVIRSSRRRKTVEARMVGEILEVRVPARLSRREEEQCVRDMVDRFERKRGADEVDVEARAASLARRYGLPVPAGVRWVDNQHRRWGSCTIETGQIRLSSVLASYPRWVLDYVLVHELAHLVEADHSPEFRALVSRYPKAERAEGFLIAKGLDGDGASVPPTGAAPMTPPPSRPVPSARLAGGAVQPSLF